MDVSSIRLGLLLIPHDLFLSESIGWFYLLLDVQRQLFSDVDESFFLGLNSGKRFSLSNMASRSTFLLDFFYL
jgi:hypothetical protein